MGLDAGADTIRAMLATGTPRSGPADPNLPAVSTISTGWRSRELRSCWDGVADDFQLRSPVEPAAVCMKDVRSLTASGNCRTRTVELAGYGSAMSAMALVR